jgi:hypothetical protein
MDYHADKTNNDDFPFVKLTLDNGEKLEVNPFLLIEELIEDKVSDAEEMNDLLEQVADLQTNINAEL